MPAMPAIEVTTPSDAGRRRASAPARCGSRHSEPGSGSSQPARRQLAEAERGERLAQRDAVGIAQVGLVGLEHPADRPAAEDAASEAPALLEPECDGPAACARATRCGDRLDRVDRREHTECAVEATTVGRRVQVRAAPHLGQLRVGARRAAVQVARRRRARPRARPRPSSRRTISNARCSPSPRPGRLVPASRPISNNASSRSSNLDARSSIERVLQVGYLAHG